MERFEVIIVGGGPVGVALAVDLGLRGVSCALVERRTALSVIPKGQGLFQRTMEHFYFWGMDDKLRAVRTMSPDHPIGQLTIYRDLLSDYWGAPIGHDVVDPYFFLKNERLPQYKTEEVLRERVAGLPSVRANFGYRATGLSQDETGVEVYVEGEGQSLTLAGDYLVGCDGGGSLVREAADIERKGTNFDEVMALVIFRSRELHQSLTRFPPRSTYRVLHPDLNGYWMFFGRVDDDESFFFHAPVPKPHDTDNVDVAALLHKAAGFAFPFEVDHLGFWDLRVQIAEKYHAGRTFIAGDAAHTHPPYGGFGLNNGLEDVANLGWKLAAALRGWGGEALLDSYSAERQPAFHDVGENLIAAGIREEREFLRAHTPERDGAAFGLLFQDLADAFSRQNRAYETHYDGSPVIVAAPGGLSGALGSYEIAARAGHHLHPQVLSTGANVYTELGPWFTLLALGASGERVAAFEAAARVRGVPLKVVCDADAVVRDAYQADTVLVRPDQFVAWSSAEQEQDPARVLDIVTGWSPRH